MLKKLLAGALLSFGICSPSFAEGIVMPKVIKPNFGGNYVIRAQVTTVNSVKDVEVGVFTVEGNEKTELDNVTYRPKIFNTRSNQLKRVFISIPKDTAQPKQQLALCMWKNQEKAEHSATSSGNTVSVFYRYCQLFRVAP